MIKVAVLGASGYGGAEVLRILSQHRGVKINYVGANSKAGLPLYKSFGNFYMPGNSSRVQDSKLNFTESKSQDSKDSIESNLQNIGNLPLQDLDLEQVASENDCIIAATPHEFLAHILSEKILKKCVVIDLSADFRLKNPAKYNEYYNFTHKNLALLKQATYGLCEFNSSAIKQAKLIANPGCYPTCSTFAIAPFLRLIEPQSIIIDAKSGVSGAGRGAKMDNLFCEVNENIKAYSLINHRHVAEIEQNLNDFLNGNFKLDSMQFIESKSQNAKDSKSRDSKSLTESKSEISITFTPHLVPMNRGILVTSYASLKPQYKNITQSNLDSMLSEFYADKFFVRVLRNGEPPQTRWVKGSNFSDVSVRLDSRNNRLIMMGALDNLIKGAAGAAVQNFNIHFDFKESESLDSLPTFP
ncbi:N-acetyl-gamma-glutamyl-phosphate reductase [Helicobacter saguini]|uniref:N-acetyl-gamma-glutamyl-phosphate reductase n=1 Tax=Helicobacter saguini TaxID=1548018 RepID=A0A347VRH7_9HELI|nr:NAGSA dehydrogenase family protein [Helicobacter saguini]MWV62896.1 N-acetyl-gamma-glutamyl-phosphate reductase [Helicobacter saguini]MWV66434.1 N-acetyl-gamma-glutamyl-phosphate reductase [Helicobacter saguini]MWV68784.1 N-acetyl-gamma-glutamyl-phosphate reductase [Helicobacter saguini]MWV71661.1 N-acetyl-gamma-glutamyl-phosphate reductase [Helicobacter saguini]TLD94463.1 N-acetyl-gamma-glutamyl-phosphate reductase [Helicobacter saguini]